MGEYETKHCGKSIEGCNEKSCELICGNSIDLDVNYTDCEIHADIVVKKIHPTVRIWGQIKDCKGRPCGNCLLKLVRIIEKCDKIEYVGVAHTISDCEGFYQFDVRKYCHLSKYKIIVSKDAVGSERKVENQEACKCCPKEPCEE